MPDNPASDDKHDIFISYASEDRPWALQLEHDLGERGFKVFLDKTNIRAGTRWEETLSRALVRSQHLVVLWSSRARESDWVRREIGHFDGRSPTPAGTTALPDSRMIFIVLEGENPQAFESLQVIDHVRAAGAYAAGIEAIDKDVWGNVLIDTDRAIRSDSNTQPVLLAIMATIKERLALVDPNSSPAGGFKSLQAFLDDLNVEEIKTVADLTNYYGNKPQEWRPFCGPKSIWTLMDELKVEINKFIPDRPIRWELIGDAFWSNNDFGTRDAEASRLTLDWSVIVIDPISLYDGEVIYRMNTYFSEAFRNPRSIFISLPPFAMLTPYLHYRELLERMAAQVYRNYDKWHTFAGQSHAKYNLNVGDKSDFQRFLLTSVGMGLRAGQTAAGSVYLHQ